MKVFKWRSPEWWSWLGGQKRRPTIVSVTRYIQSHQKIVVFHGCRPLDVESYYTNGIRVADVAELNRSAKEIFSSVGFPEITESSISSAISSINHVEQGELYVVIDKEDLIHKSGHYMIYGSERICGIGAYLFEKSGFDCRQILKRHGIPTVFHVQISVKSIPKDQIETLAERVHNDVWEGYRRIRKPFCFDFPFMLVESVPGTFIVGHEHPTVIPDPLFNYQLYHHDSQ